VTNPQKFSNQYFRLLLSLPWKPRVWDGPRQFAATAAGKELMMLPSDMALKEDPEMRKWVEIYAKDKVRSRCPAFALNAEADVDVPPLVCAGPLLRRLCQGQCSIETL
jgi:catalase (peroxidase I)